MSPENVRHVSFNVCIKSFCCYHFYYYQDDTMFGGQCTADIGSVANSSNLSPGEQFRERSFNPWCIVHSEPRWGETFGWEIPLMEVCTQFVFAGRIFEYFCNFVKFWSSTQELDSNPHSLAVLSPHRLRCENMHLTKASFVTWALSFS